MKKNKDRTYWSQSKKGDEEAFKKLFDKYFKYLTLIAMRILNNEADAKDIAQDVFLSIWKNRSKLVVNSSVKAYLHRSAINKSLNKIKARRLDFDQEEKLQGIDHKTPEKQLEQTELKEIIHKAIDKLPNRCKTIFCLSRFENMSYKEIAKKLDISPRTVEVQLAKARKFLKNSLKPFYYLMWLNLFFHFQDKGFLIYNCL